MKDGDKKKQALPDQAREAVLESAAATLAAIHMAKQVGAEVLPPRDASGARGPLAPDLELPLGDVLFGVAQLQIDFARRLFEFNRSASVLLRDRLRKNKAPPAEPRTIEHEYPVGSPTALCFTIKNSASRSKTFGFRAVLADSKDGVRIEFDPPRVTVPTDRCSDEISATFFGLPVGVHPGRIVIHTQGITVERLPFEITVTRNERRRGGK